MNSRNSVLRNTLTLAAFVVATFCAPLAGIGSLPGAWYAALAKPAWNPPAWINFALWRLNP